MSTVAAPPVAKVSVEEFIDKWQHVPAELIDGVVKELPVAGYEHGRICVRIAARILAHADAKGSGTVASNDSWVQTKPERIRGADVLYYSYERLPKGTPAPKGFHELPPDLVVEVKSPTDRWGELFEKVLEYLRVGVRAVVLLDPKTVTASVYRYEEIQQVFDDGEDLVIPDVLPGFSVPVASLFA